MADLTGLPDVADEEEFVETPVEEMTLADIQEIHDDDDKLKALKERIERGYAALCALCAHPMDDDDSDDDDEEEDDEETSDSKELISLDKALKCINNGLDLSMPKKKKKKRSLSVDGTGAASVGDDAEEDPAEMSCRLLFKKIKQASHPDKIMKFSAKIKEQILECFHNAKTYYAEEDVSALILCYIRVYLLRGEAFKVTPKMYQLAKERHNAILHHMNFLAARPYIKAIEALYRGEKELAKRLFNAYLKAKAKERDDDFDAFTDEDGEVYFEYDDVETDD